MNLKSTTLLAFLIILGFIGLFMNESQVSENWMVHCLSCIG